MNFNSAGDIHRVGSNFAHRAGNVFRSESPGEYDWFSKEFRFQGKFPIKCCAGAAPLAGHIGIDQESGLPNTPSGSRSPAPFPQQVRTTRFSSAIPLSLVSLKKNKSGTEPTNTPPP